MKEVFAFKALADSLIRGYDETRSGFAYFLDDHYIIFKKSDWENAPTVYGYKNNTMEGIWGDEFLNGHTQKAKLVCIEPIKKKCEHKEVSKWIATDGSGSLFRCCNCRQVVKPMGWEEV